MGDPLKAGSILNDGKSSILAGVGSGLFGAGIAGAFGVAVIATLVILWFRSRKMKKEGILSRRRQERLSRGGLGEFSNRNPLRRGSARGSKTRGLVL